MDLNKLLYENFTNRFGIWYSKNQVDQLSYPVDGNDSCFEIEDNSYWFRHRNNCIVSMIKTFSSKDTLFDIGGGNGFVSKSMQDNDIDVVLIEPGKRGVINAKTRGVKNIICGTTTDISELKNNVPSIGCFDVIEHINNDGEFVNELSDLLKSRSFLYCSVPAFNFLWSEEDNKAGHFRRYTLSSLSELLENSGFEIIYSTYFFSILVLPIYIMRVIPTKMKWIGRTNSKIRNDHNQSGGIGGKILDWLWRWELSRIKDQKSIPFGSSCFVVARKI